MTNSKLRVLLTRRWPQAVEDAMAQDFELRVNQDNRPMTSGACRRIGLGRRALSNGHRFGIR